MHAAPTGADCSGTSVVSWHSGVAGPMPDVVHLPCGGQAGERETLIQHTRC